MVRWVVGSILHSFYFFVSSCACDRSIWLHCPSEVVYITRLQNTLFLFFLFFVSSCACDWSVWLHRDSRCEAAAGGGVPGEGDGAQSAG